MFVLNLCPAFMIAIINKYGAPFRVFCGSCCIQCLQGFYSALSPQCLHPCLFSGMTVELMK